MNKLEQIKNNETYKQVIGDSFGGVLYDVENRDKYYADELLDIWNSMTPAEKDSADGIVKGVINFLKG